MKETAGVRMQCGEGTVAVAQRREVQAAMYMVQQEEEGRTAQGRQREETYAYSKEM